MSRSFLKLKKKLPLTCIFCIRPKSNSKNIKATISHSHSLRYNFHMNNRAIISRSYRTKTKVEQSPLPPKCPVSMQTATVRVSAHTQLSSQKVIWRLHSPLLSLHCQPEWVASNGTAQEQRSRGLATFPGSSKEQTASLCSPGLCSKNDKNICVGLFKKKKVSGTLRMLSFWEF